ncbi:MAG TPA: class I SAM-dependent methyltransferase [Streptosporangiaceae bacterium]|nr:class I SAM-dependent methyltransferase [Streptosporangiaceae bacterium]
MGFYRDQMVPRITNTMMNRAEFRPIRDRVAAGLAGEVLEVGFGSGLNVPHYPRAVSRVLAVDPARAGRRLAAGRLAVSPVPVEFAGLDGEELPWPDDRFDHVLITWTLCTIPDPGRALAEIYRVLRPGGALHFAEHGRSPDRAVARWQDRLTPLQRRVAGGCHLGRPMGQLIAGSGLRIIRMDNYYVQGPKAFGYMFEGRAAKPREAA